MKDSLIIVKNVFKKFDDRVILNDINLNIKEGKITGLVGRNGSGKSVLLKIISGLYFPTEGEIIYKDGYSIKEDFGILIDNDFLDSETGFENLKMLALLKNKLKDEDIYRILNFVKLNPYDKTLYKNYSTGMKQKLRIAQALMENPRVLILDEPFNGLDKESVAYFRKVFLELREKGTSIIITSHYQEDINELCDIVYEIIDGELV